MYTTKAPDRARHHRNHPDYYRNKKQNSILFNLKKDKKWAIFQFFVPGISIEEIDINYEGNLLTVLVNKKSEEPVANLRTEFLSPSGQRSFRLNEQYDLENISAELKNGLLELKIPFIGQQNKIQNITIQ